MTEARTTGPRAEERRRLAVLGRLRPHHVPGASRRAVRSWRAYRERQLAELAESNRLQQELREQLRHPVRAQLVAPDEPSTSRPWWQASPFYVGFTFALGALLAWLLVQNLTRLTSVLTFIVVAVFVTLTLDPVVQWLTRRSMGRGGAVVLVFLGLVGVVTVIGLLVVPPIVTQTAALVDRTPDYVENLTTQPWLARLDERFDLSAWLAAEADQLATDRSTLSTIFGGVLGAAGWVAGSLVGLATTIILTLYLLATLPTVKEAGYRLVPHSKRERVVGLAEEIMRRVGGYALGQGAVATINAVCSWVMMQILSIPYSAMLAVLVGLLGLIPMVGATLGAVLVGVAAMTVSPTAVLVVVVYYVVYQQFENYVIVPSIMRRTVSVPGAVTVVAVLVGGTLLGVLGALIAIPVAAGLLLIYHQVLVPRQDRL
ncbi:MULTISPECIES: AI-2E family transporter [unclassified Ornithinimicrobium]|uniref:AI-2E family transporter n=1 Tax=unclassified Ornithinimicrobium TaxID=2615080 RepID=UPI0038532969